MLGEILCFSTYLETFRRKKIKKIRIFKHNRDLFFGKSSEFIQKHFVRVSASNVLQKTLKYTMKPKVSFKSSPQKFGGVMKITAWGCVVKNNFVYFQAEIDDLT